MSDEDDRLDALHDALLGVPAGSKEEPLLTRLRSVEGTLGPIAPEVASVVKERRAVRWIIRMALVGGPLAATAVTAWTVLFDKASW